MSKIVSLLTLMQTRRKAIFVTVAVIFWLAAFGYSFYLGDRLRYPDERWYFNDYAQNLAKLHRFSRDGISPTAFHPPLYPLLLGGLVMAGGGVVAARLVNFLALFLTWVGLFLYLEKRSQGLASIFAVILALFYPVLFYTAGTLYPQTVGALFFVLAVILYWREPLRPRDAVLTGVAIGLSVLTIPTFLFVPFFMFVFSLLFRRSALRNTILVLLVTLLTITPWGIRNYLVFHRFILLSTNSGLNFLIGNNPTTTPTSGVNVDIQPILDEATRRGLDEFDANQLYTQKALQFIQQDTKRYLFLYFMKVINYFNFRNELATSSEASVAKEVLMLITYGCLVLLTMIRLSLLRRYPLCKEELFTLLLYLSSAFVIAIFFTRIRFRLPFDYLLITTAALTLERLALPLLPDKQAD